MKPIKFKQANKSFEKSNKTEGELCQSLHVCSNGKEHISCWTMSIYQRLIILFTGKIYLGVISGNSHPPVYLNAINPLTLTSIQKWKRWWRNIQLTFFDFLESTQDFWADFFNHFTIYFQKKEIQMYIIAGTIIAGISSFIFTPLMAIGIVFISSITKEYIDAHQIGNYWNWLDIIFMLLGSLSGCLTAILLQYLFQ